MEYTIIVNDKSYDLPKKTLAVMEKLDNVLKVDTVRNLTVKQKYEKLHTFVKELVGTENAAEMFGSDNISEIDLSELALAVKKINASYDKPVSDFDTEMRNEKLNNLPMEKIISLTKAAQTTANMQMMGR